MSEFDSTASGNRSPLPAASVTSGAKRSKRPGHERRKPEEEMTYDLWNKF